MNNEKYDHKHGGLAAESCSDPACKPMSSKPKWTPGPWKPQKIERDPYSKTVGGRTREEMDYAWRIEPETYTEKCRADGTRPPHFTVARIPPDICQHAEANAYLIAAAPLMAEALEALGDALDCNLPPDVAESPDFISACVKARAALAAAKGERP